jgi:hypothetical protein
MDPLSSLNRFNEGKVSKNPTDVEMVFYLFWDKGIGFEEFCDYPIPYVMSIIKSLNYVKDLERKEFEKSKKGKGNGRGFVG